MATCRQVITAALRKPGVLGTGRRAPNPSEAVDGLSIFQSLCDGLVSGGAFCRFTEVIASAAYTAKENERIQDGGHTITLPTLISDDPNSAPRAPYDLSMVVVVGTNPIRKVWDASLASWVSFDNLGLDSTAPLAARDMDGCACWLATAYAEEFGKSVGAETKRRGAMFKHSLITQFSAPGRQAVGSYF